MKDRDELNFTSQMRFGSDGMEVDQETDTDLADWGIVAEEETRESQIEVQQASSFGVDDRELEPDRDPGEQADLVISTEEGQMDLTGKEATDRMAFGD